MSGRKLSIYLFVCSLFVFVNAVVTCASVVHVLVRPLSDQISDRDCTGMYLTWVLENRIASRAN